MAADVVSEILGCEPRSLVNPPYHDEATIRADLATARFEKIDIQRVTQPARAASAHAAAVATVHGSLIRTVIESKAPERLQEATNAVEQAFRARYGDGEIAGATKGLVIAAGKPAA